MNWNMINHKHYASEKMRDAENARMAEKVKESNERPRRWWNR